MTSQSDLIYQLEDILASKYVSRRVEILQRVTDLFVIGSGKFSEEHVDLFDHVMGKLLENVESAARAQFGIRIAALPDAPPKIIRKLAFARANGSTKTCWSKPQGPRARIICWRSPVARHWPKP
jgi:hypothetical protein